MQVPTVMLSRLKLPTTVMAEAASELALTPKSPTIVMAQAAAVPACIFMEPPLIAVVPVAALLVFFLISRYPAMGLAAAVRMDCRRLMLPTRATALVLQGQVCLLPLRTRAAAKVPAAQV